MINLRRTLLITALLCVSVLVSAQNTHKVELSAGVGDQIFETLVWHKTTTPFGLLPEYEVVNLDSDFRYSQHWFVNGTYRVNRHLGVGAMVDASGVSWNNADYEGDGDVLVDYGRDFFVNIVVMPTLAFNYLNRKYVSLHSGLGVGVNINTGSEVDFLGEKTGYAPAVYLNPIGIRGTYGRFFASFDLGGMFSLTGTSKIYMAGSRLMSLSVGVTL